MIAKTQLMLVVAFIASVGSPTKADESAFSCGGAIAKLSTPAKYNLAVEELEAHAATCIPEFSAALKDPATSVHKAGTISGILCRMKDRPTEVNDLLVYLATSAPGMETRRAATYGLACLPTERAVAELRGALQSSDVRIRQNAVRSFARNATLVERLLPELLAQLLSDENEEVRCWSVEATESLGAKSAKVLPYLRKARHDRSEYVRDCIEETIGLIQERVAANAGPPN